MKWVPLALHPLTISLKGVDMSGLAFMPIGHPEP
jgi:hypothetical protein